MIPPRPPLRELAERVALAGIAEADAGRAVARHLGHQTRAGVDTLTLAHLSRPLGDLGRLEVLGAGKAAATMAAAAWDRLGSRITGGLVITPHGGPEAVGPIEVAGAHHPTPDEAGVQATRRLLARAAALGPDDHALVMISGGASSLLVAPAEGLTLEDLVATSRVLLGSGADIHDMNRVRRHLSAVKGGWLAAHLHPCPSWTMILSDVVGDDLSAVGSGPTLPDPSTPAHALAVLDHYGIRDRVPAAVVAHLERGEHDTPAPGNPWFGPAEAGLVGSVVDAAAGAALAARDAGFDAEVRNVHLTGEAAEVGRQLASRARALRRAVLRPTARLFGGETTVTLPPDADGVGGRNQELCLAAAEALAGIDGVVLFSVGTDGVDGPTDAAGAVVDGQTWGRIAAAGLDPADHLARHDSHPALQAAGALVHTGPTGTNVADVLGILVLPDPTVFGEA